MPASVGSILIVTYNSAGSIEICVRALVHDPNWEIIIIDNASQDQTVQLIKKHQPRVRLVQNSSNAGFAAAVNQGVRTAQGDILLVLNPDCVAREGTLDRLAEIFIDPKVMTVGGLLIGPDGQPQKGFVLRRFPTLARMLSEIFLLNRVWPSNPWNRRYRCLELDYAKGQEADQPAGACLAFRREVWQRVGGFDESFFPVWFEDVDFCRRIRDAGMKILYSPKVLFTHVGAHSVGLLPYVERQLYWYANLQRYFRKHHLALELSVLRLGIVIGLILRSFLAFLGAKPEGVGRLEAIRAHVKVICSLNETDICPPRT